MAFFPSKRKEKVKNWPGRALRIRPSGTMKRSVLAFEACGVMLANLRIRTPPGDAVGAARTPAGACDVGAGMACLSPERRAFDGRRIARVSALKSTNPMKPIVRALYRLSEAGRLGATAA